MGQFCCEKYGKKKDRKLSWLGLGFMIKIIDVGIMLTNQLIQPNKHLHQVCITFPYITGQMIAMIENS